MNKIIDKLKSENSIMKNELEALRIENNTLQELLYISESKVYRLSLKLDEYEDIIDSFENKYSIKNSHLN